MFKPFREVLSIDVGMEALYNTLVLSPDYCPHLGFSYMQCK